MSGEKHAEYWFHEYYRVVKTCSDEGCVLSVDVYRKKYPFKHDQQICVNNGRDCILYKYIQAETPIHGVKDIIITGVKTGDIHETVNVRWILDHDPGYEEVEEAFYESWRIIGCAGPKDNPWHTGCPESKSRNETQRSPSAGKQPSPQGQSQP